MIRLRFMGPLACLLVGGCWNPPAPEGPTFADDTEAITGDVDTGALADTEAEVTTPDSDGGTVEPKVLCPPEGPCVLHCFRELNWAIEGGTTVKAIECLQLAGPNEVGANQFDQIICSDTIDMAGKTTGAVEGPCPLDIAFPVETGWGEMTQVAGCETTQTWYYALTDDATANPGLKKSPTISEVENRCIATGSVTTLVQCVPDLGCDDGAPCEAVLCSDNDKDLCSTLRCLANTDAGGVCDFDLDHAVCSEKTCAEGTCKAGKGCQTDPDDTVCGDDDPCKKGSCQPDAETSDPVTGCVEENEEDGGDCDDNNNCTVNDQCGDGVCSGVPMDCSAEDSECTVGTCNDFAGVCTPIPTNSTKDCTTTNLCAAIQPEGTKNGVCVDGGCDPKAFKDCSAEDSDCT
ncbi:MAG: hypothetical protein QF464_20680, partial [Myxococcota bacterium]|nr:hypothetical protein [Myxococcota bacterium]